MKKILIIFGTRPEAIKMAPLVKEIQKHQLDFSLKVCVTAQHRQMLDQVLNVFNIIPDYDLNIMKKGQDLFDITSNVLLNIKEVLKESKPDMVLVHGDTTTSSIASLAAFYLQIPVGHVEAGLRTNDIYSPFPEEINRQLTGRIASYHFAPTQKAKQNLLNEGVNENKIWVTGNTVIDALHLALQKINEDKKFEADIAELLDKNFSFKKRIKNHQKIILITGHRRENFGQGFINICSAIREIAISFPEYNLVYPVHLNPNVQKPVYDLLGDIPNIFLIDPLDYLPFIYLMNKSYMVLTDSGGIQEEAPSLGKPVLVMRDTTERPEALSAGTVKLVGTNKDLIIETITKLINNQDYYTEMSRAVNPYGDGKACQRIIDVLKNS